jgi:FAE1/Type III polyketide synthase-like protein
MRTDVSSYNLSGMVRAVQYALCCDMQFDIDSCVRFICLLICFPLLSSSSMPTLLFPSLFLLSYFPPLQGCSAGLISVELVKNMLAAKPHSTALIGKTDGQRRLSLLLILILTVEDTDDDTDYRYC